MTICYKCKEREVPEGKKYRLCKPCNAEASRKFREKNPEKIKQYEKNRSNSRKRFWIEQRYGLSEEQFSSLLIKQNNVCAICGLNRELGRGKHLHVDHDHTTGKVRGLLCNFCNRGLGLFRDNITLLEKAIGYLNEN